MRKMTWPRPFGMTIEMISFPSDATRASSPSARAGIMAVKGWGTGWESVPLRTDSRKPSAAAMVMVSLSTDTSTPIRTGLASSAEAAKITCAIMSLKSATFKRTAPSISGTGNGGNSWASMHLMSVFEAPQRTFRVWLAVARLRLTCSCGNVPTRSTKVRAGNGGRAFLLDLGADPAGDPEFQIGSR